MQQHQERLRLFSFPSAVISGRLAAKRSMSLIAASPRGDFVKPLAKSPTVEYATPIASAISRRETPFDSSNRIFSDHEVLSVLMGYEVYGFPLACQLDSVTTTECNLEMKDKPKNLPTFGARVKEWREYRGISRSDLADAIGVSYSTLGDIENEGRSSSKYLTQLAKALGLTPQYLATGKGDPETDHPFPLDIDPSRLENLSSLERKHISLRLSMLLDEIENIREQEARKKAK